MSGCGECTGVAVVPDLWHSPRRISPIFCNCSERHAVSAAGGGPGSEGLPAACGISVVVIIFSCTRDHSFD